MIRTPLLSWTHEKARTSAFLFVACITLATSAKAQSLRYDSLPWTRIKPVPVKPWFPLLGQRAELPYRADSVEQRSTCPMPVAHSHIVDPMPVAGVVPALPDSVISAPRRRTPDGMSRGMPMERVPPCYNPLDVKPR